MENKNIGYKILTDMKYRDKKDDELRKILTEIRTRKQWNYKKTWI